MTTRSLSYEEVLREGVKPLRYQIDLTTLTLEDLSTAMAGFGCIDFEEFCAVLRDTIGADRGYAIRQWASFTYSPIGYCATRDPIVQGERLAQLALQKAQARRR